jgi:hypothetical protein
MQLVGFMRSKRSSRPLGRFLLKIWDLDLDIILHTSLSSILLWKLWLRRWQLEFLGNFKTR